MRFIEKASFLFKTLNAFKRQEIRERSLVDPNIYLMNVLKWLNKLQAKYAPIILELSDI
jgi:hypothetical protein